MGFLSWEKWKCSSGDGYSSDCTKNQRGAALAVQWLRLCTSTAGGMGLIPCQRTKILHVTRHDQKQTNKKIRKKKNVHVKWMNYTAHKLDLNKAINGFPGSSAGKESSCNAGDPGSIPGLRRSPGEGNGCPLQYSGLKNSMEWIVHGLTKTRIQLSDFHFTFKAIRRETTTRSLERQRDNWRNQALSSKTTPPLLVRVPSGNHKVGHTCAVSARNCPPGNLPKGAQNLCPHKNLSANV